MDDWDERASFLEKELGPYVIDARSGRKEGIWRTVAILSFALCIIQTSFTISWMFQEPKEDSYEAGFNTDHGSFKSSIGLVKTRFSGALHPDENGTLFLVPNTKEPRYVGAQSDEIDQNWDDLISGRYFRFTSSEIQELEAVGKEAGVQEPNAINTIFNTRGVFGGIDMFHSLHCLNSIRLAVNGIVDPQYSKEFTQIHIDHCVEQLRQAILCHGDLTPVTLTPVFEEKARRLALVGQTKYPHTCRDWSSFRNIMNSRDSIESEIGIA